MKIEKITKTHNKKQFDCGIEPLNNYLKAVSGQHEKKHLARTFGLVSEEDNTTIIGYYTLALMTVDTSSLPDSITKRLPKGELKCALLGRLAIDKRHQRKGHGEYLLVDAIRNTYIASQTVPTPMLVVEAKDGQAKSFYQRYGFIPFPDEPLRLFLTMKDTEKLLFDSGLLEDIP